MKAKDIKRLVTRQLKAKFPKWQRLIKRDKKSLAKKVVDEVIANYKEDQWTQISLHELTNMPEVPPDVIPL